jgi:hypothetical protein
MASRASARKNFFVVHLMFVLTGLVTRFTVSSLNVECDFAFALCSGWRLWCDL